MTTTEPSHHAAETAERYLHGSSLEERDRLSRMNDWINSQCLGILRVESGMRVLDVGSGLGQLARLCAHASGSDGLVVGVEKHEGQLAGAKQFAADAGEDGLVDFRHGSAFELPLSSDEAGTFDLAYCRFLLEHVRDPLGVVRSMLGAVREGGRVVLIDDDHDRMRFTPECEPLERLWAALIESYRVNGNDPDVGRKLVSLLHKAGAAPAQNGFMFFGSCAGSPTWETAWRNMVDVIQSSQETILENELLLPAELADGVAVAAEWARKPDAAIWYGACWAEGTRV